MRAHVSCGDAFTTWLPDVGLLRAEAQLVGHAVNQRWEASSIWPVNVAEPGKASELTCDVLIVTDAHEGSSGTCSGVSCLLPLRAAAPEGPGPWAEPGRL